MENFESKGFWWLPNQMNERIAGILSFKADESATLELIGTLDSSRTPFDGIFESRAYDVILGVNENGIAITLLKCFLTNDHRNTRCDFPITVYSAQYILVGQHLNSADDKLFNRCEVELPSLTRWCFPALITSDFKRQHKTHLPKSMGLSVDCSKLNQAIDSVEIEELGINISLLPQIRITWDIYAPQTSQQTILVVESSEKKSLFSFLHNVHIFKEFLTFATLANVEETKFTLQHKNLSPEHQNDEEKSETISLYYIEYDTNKKKQSKDRSLFNYDLIKNDFHNIIRKWYLESNSIAPIRSHLIQSIRPKKNFSSIDFLIVFQAIEGYMIRFLYGDTGVKNNLNKLIKEYSDIQDLNCDKIDVDAVVESRNYYSHFMLKSKKPKTLEGYELFCQTRKLQDLLICCMLSFIGLDHDKINNLIINSQWNFFNVN